jgi:hypothetical protein
VLQTVYGWVRRTGTWPKFGQIDRPLRKADLDLVAVIKSIPRSLLPAFQAGRATPQIDEFLGTRNDSDTASARLYDILRLEHWGWNRSGIDADTGEWHVRVSRDVARFGRVEALADYQTAGCFKIDMSSDLVGAGGFEPPAPRL